MQGVIQKIQRFIILSICGFSFIQTGCDPPKKYFNTLPIIESLESNPAGTVSASSDVTITVKADDADGDVLEYSWTASGGKFDKTDSRMVVWTAPAVPGTHTIGVSVTDGQGGSDNKTIQVTVESSDLIVANFLIQEGFESLTLTWENPSSDRFKYVKIMRSTGDFPLRYDYGDSVYQGTGTIYTDRYLSNGIRYYYSAFVHYESGEWGSKVEAVGTPSVSGGTPVTGLNLDKSALSLVIGSNDVLKAVIVPDDADNKNLYWESSNEDIATVSDKGLVIAKKKGQAVITVRSEANSNAFAVCTVNVVTVANGPDLTVSLSVDSANVETGQQIKLSADIFNNGDMVSDPTKLKYYRSDDATIDSGDSYLDYDNVSSISAGSSTSEYEYVDAPSSPGTYYYGVIADTVSGESDTSNNGSPGVRVEVALPAVPDITLENPRVSDSEVNVNEGFTFYSTLRNLGNYRAEDIEITYYQSPDSTINTGDTVVGDGGFLSELPAGEYREASEYITPTSSGTYYYGAIVQLRNGGETNTANNVTSGVQVQVNTPAVYKITKMKFYLTDAHEPLDNTAEIFFTVKEWDSFGGRTLWQQGSATSPTSLSEGDYIPYSGAWHDIPDTETSNFWISLSDKDVSTDDTVSGSTVALNFSTGEHWILFGGGTGPEGMFYYYVEEF